MIKCDHKLIRSVPNWGVEAELCLHFGLYVNEEICSACTQCKGEGTDNPHPIQMARRSVPEVDRIRTICKGCPMRDVVFLTCKRQNTNDLPTDIYSQNPATHCEDEKW